ncbi:MAG: hypothetical protein R3C61_27785 [Bacteroidia bacterium]
MMPNPKVGADEPVVALPHYPSWQPIRRRRLPAPMEDRVHVQHLQTNGYHLEDLNLKKAKPASLMALVATAYLLALREGWRRRKKIPLKKYADGTRWPACSLFRTGLAYLIEKSQQLQRFLTYLDSITKTPKPLLIKNV